MTIYEIDASIAACMAEAVDPETGEVSENLDTAALSELMLAREEKIEGVACWIKNLRAYAADIRAEEIALAERRRKAEKRAERLSDWLAEILAGEKFRSPRAEVSFRKSTTVEVEDVQALPEELLTVKLEYKPDKQAIKLRIKSGEELPGCSLVEKSNIQIR